MEDARISYETGLLAKKKGYNWPTSHLAYMFEGVTQLEPIVNRNNANMADSWCSIPTQSLLQKWLRDEAHIHLWVTPIVDSAGLTKTKFYFNKGYAFQSDTYEEALEEGIKWCLNYLP